MICGKSPQTQVGCPIRKKLFNTNRLAFYFGKPILFRMGTYNSFVV
jgi:hypothetical protein